MNYGLWMSAAGLSTEVHRQDIIANNVANAETAGFKADTAFTIERPAPAQDLGLAALQLVLLPQDLLHAEVDGLEVTLHGRRVQHQHAAWRAVGLLS